MKMTTNPVSARRIYSSIAIGILLLVIAPGAMAQWSTAANGTDIYKTNTAGNVGVGTQSPAWSLDVTQNQNSLTAINVGNTTTGTAARTGYLLTTNGGVPGGLVSTGTGYSPSGIYVPDGLQLVWDNPGGLTIAARHSAGAIKFFTGGSAERMRIDSAGNVGIGTTNPAHKLTVSGGWFAADNGYGLAVKDSGGTARTIIYLDSGNTIQVGNTL